MADGHGLFIPRVMDYVFFPKIESFALYHGLLDFKALKGEFLRFVFLFHFHKLSYR